MGQPSRTIGGGLHGHVVRAPATGEAHSHVIMSTFRPAGYGWELRDDGLFTRPFAVFNKAWATLSKIPTAPHKGAPRALKTNQRDKVGSLCTRHLSKQNCRLFSHMPPLKTKSSQTNLNAVAIMLYRKIHRKHPILPAAIHSSSRAFCTEALLVPVGMLRRIPWYDSQGVLLPALVRMLEDPPVAPLIEEGLVALNLGLCALD